MKTDTTMDIQDLICTGQAHVVMNPSKKGNNDYCVNLIINGKDYGEHPTYTAAANHLETLANG